MMTQQFERKSFDPGFVNCVTHSLTGGQVLFHLLLTWQMEPNRSIILWCKRSDAQPKANAIRVALSKERKARNVVRTFELRFSEPWPYTHLGIKGEAIKVIRVDGTMQTRVQAAFLAIQYK